jgi:hypothetical protein
MELLSLSELAEFDVNILLSVTSIAKKYNLLYCVSTYVKTLSGIYYDDRVNVYGTDNDIKLMKRTLNQHQSNVTDRNLNDLADSLLGFKTREDMIMFFRLKSHALAEGLKRAEEKECYLCVSRVMSSEELEDIAFDNSFRICGSKGDVEEVIKTISETDITLDSELSSNFLLLERVISLYEGVKASSQGKSYQIQSSDDEPVHDLAFDESDEEVKDLESNPPEKHENDDLNLSSDKNQEKTNEIISDDERPKSSGLISKPSDKQKLKNESDNQLFIVVIMKLINQIQEESSEALEDESRMQDLLDDLMSDWDGEPSNSSLNVKGFKLNVMIVIRKLF